MIVLRTVSFLGLALTLVPSILVFLNVVQLEDYKTLMLIGTLLWFLTAPFWINKSKVK